MTDWYYAGGGSEQIGPVPATQLQALFQSGAITHDTLVWRAGLDGWQPLQRSFEELGLRDPPPPVPPMQAVTTDPSPYLPPTAAVLGEAPIVNGGEVVYAGFWKRVAAYAIDAILVGIVGAIIGGTIGAVLGMLLLGTGNSSANASGLLLIQGVANVLGLVLGVTYFAWMHASSTMATLGKMAIGIKVVRENGERISFMRGVGRYFALIVSSLPLGIGFAMAGFTERKRALHDMLCDTVVVDKWAFTPYPERQHRELGTLTIIVLVLFGLLAVIAMLAITAAIFMAAKGWH
ncbi:MAG TPA: RDD family protein [Thermomonas sp.]|jgi:uncharacterized RDD family membrane protein YckC|uniref:RDD family protein n=1 Tax=Thermomonas sp. TaxID=1971895 RepID=UPI002B9BE5B3|nr:RDD family protein [Thermomonas sp.]HOV95994.1 RDD family protein [Thermomonas sp.]